MPSTQYVLKILDKYINRILQLLPEPSHIGLHNRHTGRFHQCSNELINERLWSSGFKLTSNGCPDSTPFIVNRADLSNKEDTAEMMVCDFQSYVMKDITLPSWFLGSPMVISGGRQLPYIEDTQTDSGKGPNSEDPKPPASRQHQYSSRECEPPWTWIPKSQSSLHTTAALANILTVRSRDTLSQNHLAELLPKSESHKLWKITFTTVLATKFWDNLLN